MSTSTSVSAYLKSARGKRLTAEVKPVLPTKTFGAKDNPALPRAQPTTEKIHNRYWYCTRGPKEIPPAYPGTVASGLGSGVHKLVELLSGKADPLAAGTSAADFICHGFCDVEREAAVAVLQFIQDTMRASIVKAEVKLVNPADTGDMAETHVYTDLVLEIAGILYATELKTVWKETAMTEVCTWDDVSRTHKQQAFMAAALLAQKPDTTKEVGAATIHVVVPTESIVEHMYLSGQLFSPALVAGVARKQDQWAPVWAAPPVAGLVTAAPPQPLDPPAEGTVRIDQDDLPWRYETGPDGSCWQPGWPVSVGDILIGMWEPTKDRSGNWSIDNLQNAYEGKVTKVDTKDVTSVEITCVWAILWQTLIDGEEPNIDRKRASMSKRAKAYVFTLRYGLGDLLPPGSKPQSDKLVLTKARPHCTLQPMWPT